MTENYKSSAKFKTQIYKEEDEKNSDSKNNEINKNNDITQNSTSSINDDLKNNENNFIFSPNMKSQNDEKNSYWKRQQRKECNRNL